MKVKCAPSKGLGENCYVYYDEDTLDAVMVDPGGGAARLADWRREGGLNLGAVLLTHGHFDHVDGLGFVSGVPVYGMAAEQPLFADPALNGSIENSPAPITVAVDKRLSHGDVVEAGGIRLTALHTPGHTAGSCCYYDEANGVLFTGDTLFFHSVGRTDFPTGDWAALERSLRDVLYALPDDVKVYPGHGVRTTIGEEKAENPFVKG